MRKEAGQKTNVSTATKIGITILISLTIYFAPQPFLPILIYDYDETNMHLLIWNVGQKPATNVLVEIIPVENVTINKIIPESLDGEIINKYSKNNTVIFHLYHLYNKNFLMFTLENEQKITSKDIEIIIRSDQSEGIEASTYFGNFLIHVQWILFFSAIIFASTLFVFFSGILSKYIQKKNEE